MNYKLFFLTIVVLLSIFSCKKEDVKPIETPQKYGSMLLKFDNRIGIEELSLNGVTYQNRFGENFTVSQVDYYISNISLTRQDGTIFTIPKDSCQFLMQEEDFLQQWFLLKNIPEGTYKAIALSIGIENPNLKNLIFDKNNKAKSLFEAKENDYVAFFIKGKVTEKDSFEYKVIQPKPLKIMELSFGEYRAEVKELAKGYSTSAHIFCDLSKFFNANPLSTLPNFQQKNWIENLLVVNHVENR